MHQKTNAGSRKKRRRAVIICIAAVIAVLLAVFIKVYLYPELKIRRPAYAAGVEAMGRKEYHEAIRQFRICGADYNDSAEKIAECTELQKDADLAAIGQWLVPEDTKNAQAELTGFTELYQYDNFDESDKKIFRNSLQEGFRRYLKAGKDSETEQLVTILTDAWQNRALWEAELTYARAELSEGNRELAANLQEVRELAAEGAPDAAEHLEEIEKEFHDAAVRTAKQYQKDADPEDAREAIRMFGLLGTEESQVAEELDELCGTVEKSAKKCLKKGAYEEAKELYQMLLAISRDGAEEALKDIYYQMAEDRYQSGDLIGAIRAWYMIKGYKDADSRETEAKYRYCEETADHPDETAERYIEELKEAQYPGAERLYDQIHSWHTELSMDLLVDEDGEAGTFVVRAALSGGGEDETTALEFVIEGPEEQQYSYMTDEAFRSGETAEVVIDTLTDEGTISLADYSVEVYDDAGRLIGSMSGADAEETEEDEDVEESEEDEDAEETKEDEDA